MRRECPAIGRRTMARPRSNSGRRLNEQWGVNARHALYHREGIWYERLERFPGALFDENGYVVFATAEEFTGCPDLRITQKVWVPRGISEMPDYHRMVITQPRTDSSESWTFDLTDAFEEGGVKFQLHRRKERNRKAAR